MGFLLNLRVFSCIPIDNSEICTHFGVTLFLLDTILIWNGQKLNDKSEKIRTYG